MEGQILGREALKLLDNILLETNDLHKQRLAETKCNPLIHTHWLFLSKHLLHIRILGEQVLDANDRLAITLARLGSRSMLESYFQIAATHKRPMFPAEKMVYDLEDNLRRSKESLEKEMHDRISKQVQEIRLAHNITGVLKWSVFETAQLGGNENRYRIDYMILSNYSHATAGVMLILDPQKNDGLILETALQTMVCSTGLCLQMMPTKSRKSHSENVNSLLKRFLKLRKENYFRDKYLLS